MTNNKSSVAATLPKDLAASDDVRKRYLGIA